VMVEIDRPGTRSSDGGDWSAWHIVKWWWRLIGMAHGQVMVEIDRHGTRSSDGWDWSTWHTVKWWWRWVKSSWLSSRHASVVCQVTMNTNLRRRD